ncbi:MAG: hypothetical protein ABR599_05120 [Gemmatimonadota bacterium]
MKAGRVTPGVALTRQGLANGTVRFVLLADDLAPGRSERLVRAAGSRGVAWLGGWRQTELGRLLDRGPTGAVGVLDDALARGMAAILDATSEADASPSAR